MSLYSLSQKIDKTYNQMSPNRRAWTAIIIVTIILLLLSASILALYSKHLKESELAAYEAELEKSKQNYYLQTIANSNLEKKLQDMSLRLAETINNTIELERMFHELSEEKVSLEEIRSELEAGIRRTKYQLDNMQGAVNSLINQRQKVIITTEEDIIIEKSNTHGKY
jgi:hypothetical protein